MFEEGVRRRPTPRTDRGDRGGTGSPRASLPSADLLNELVRRIAQARPPICQRLSPEGEPENREVEGTHCLYSGWIYWFGKDALAAEAAASDPDVQVLSFLELNRLCDQALLQQRAIHRMNDPGVRATSTPGRGELIARMQVPGDLSVTPILSKSQIGAASIDLRMGNVVLMVRARGSSHVDPAEVKKAADKDHARELVFQQKHERHELPFKSAFLLHPGALALVPTLEWVTIPRDLIGAVTARST